MRQYIQLLRYHKWAIPVIVALLVGVESVQLIPSLTEDEPYPDYYYFVLPYVFSCDVSDPFEGPNRNHLAWWLRCASFQVTGHPNFFGLFFNMAIMPMTYMLSMAITKDRIISLIAFVTMINIPLYTDWSNSGTYDMVWAFFVMLAVYLVYVGNKFGVLSFFVGVTAKSMTLLYIPAWLYSLVRQKQYAQLILTLIGVGIVSLLVYDNIPKLVGNDVGFYPENWEQAVFRNISLLWQVIPLMMALGGLYVTFKPKNGSKGIRDVGVWIGWILLTTPIIHLFTEQLTFTYRFVIFGSFLSILTGQVINNIGTYIMEIQMKRKLQA